MKNLLNVAIPLEDKKLIIPGRINKQIINKLKQFVTAITVRGKLSKRHYFKRGHSITSDNIQRGRCFRTESVRNISQVELVPTIRQQIRWGVRKLVPIRKEFWCRYIRTARPLVIVMLIIDCSRSSYSYLTAISNILTVLFENYFDPSSKVGLVVIENSRSVIRFTPTKNRLKVFGELKRLQSGGFSPLAEALRIARTELIRQKRFDNSLKPFAILVSDCYPEPLPMNELEPYERKPYKDVRKQVKYFARHSIPIAVIDSPDPSLILADELPGRRLAKFIAKKTSGVFIPLSPKKCKTSGIAPSFVKDSLYKINASKLSEKMVKMLTEKGRSNII